MPKVLIVDDEPDILLMLQVTLEAAGYDIALAADGEVALQRMRQEPFDLVLLDVMMPVLDGWSVLEALEGVADAPSVIVVSAKSTERDRERASTLGAAAFVAKPFANSELLAEMQRILDNPASSR